MLDRLLPSVPNIRLDLSAALFTWWQWDRAFSISMMPHNISRLAHGTGTHNMPPLLVTLATHPLRLFWAPAQTVSLNIPLPCNSLSQLDWAFFCWLIGGKGEHTMSNHRHISCIQLNRVALNNQVVAKGTEQVLFLSPSSYWEQALRCKVDDVLRWKYLGVGEFDQMTPIVLSQSMTVPSMTSRNYSKTPILIGQPWKSSFSCGKTCIRWTKSSDLVYPLTVQRTVTKIHPGAQTKEALHQWPGGCSLNKAAISFGWIDILSFCGNGPSMGGRRLLPCAFSSNMDNNKDWASTYRERCLT